jgi:beta-lactamase superfamily II metal-dependent hydrolase
MKRYTVPNLMHSLKAFVLFLIVMPYFGSSRADVVIPREERVTTRLIVREGSSTKTPEVGELRIGENAEFLESVPRWRKVRLTNNTVGFVSKAYSLVIPTPPPSATMRIHTFNVGTGACSLIECPGTDAPPLFVECGQDAGGRSQNTLDLDTAKIQIEQILSNHTVAPNVVVTHAHNDHYNWLPRILDNTNTSRIWLGGVLTEYDNNEMDTWLTNQEANGAVINDGLGQLPPDWHNDEQALDQKLSCGLASTFVLTTNSGSTDSSKSMVLMIEYENFRAIFPGDAQKITEDQAIKNFGDVTTTMLLGSHHGAKSASSNSPDWVSKTEPKIVIYSSGKKHGHPTCTAMDRHRNGNHLADVPTHKTQCLNSSSDYPGLSTSDQGEYVTDAVGSILISTDGRERAAISCSGDTQCGTEISF